MIKFSNVLVLSCLFTQMLLTMDKKISFTEEDKECYVRLRNLGVLKKGHYWDIGFNLIYKGISKESVEALAGELGQLPTWTQPPLQGTLVYGQNSYCVTGNIADIIYHWQIRQNKIYDNKR